MPTPASPSGSAGAGQSSLRDAPAQTLLLLLPDRAAYPEGWNVAVADRSQDPPASDNAAPPLPACADPIRGLTRNGAVRELVLSKGYDARAHQERSTDADNTPEALALEGKLSEIMVTYLRESDSADVISAYRDWAERCPEGNTSADVHENVTIIDGADTKPDPSITIRITASHPALDTTAPATTTVLSIARTRGVVVFAELQNSDDLSILAPVVQSALAKLRTA